jgi:hypothetical protein
MSRKMPKRKTSLKANEVNAMLRALSRHFDEPVMPISKYCDALLTWAAVINEAVRAGEGDDDLKELSQSIGTTFLGIRKSNLLARLLYAGEELRTEKCPVHKGRWTGYSQELKCVNERYPFGCDYTGWLPTEKLRLRQLKLAQSKDG